jgi:uncharacterized protein YfaP (DUF2135 family)
VLGTGDVQVTLRWASGDDLDLHVIDPNGEEIYFNVAASSSGGRLDTDANSDCEGVAPAPVENVFWPPGRAPSGTYQVSVENFTACDRTRGTDYTLTVMVDGQVALDDSGTVAEGESDPFSFPVGR